MKSDSTDTTVGALGKFAARLKEVMAGSSTGPLIIAKEVMEIADQWEAFADESDGQSCTAWLKATCGKGRGLGWWRKRAAAVDFLGESCRRTTDHEVAVYCLGRVPADRVKDVRSALRTAQRENNGTPITIAMAKTLLDGILGHSAQRQRNECDNCKALRAQLISIGVDPVV